MATKVKPEFISLPIGISDLPQRHWLRLEVHDDWVRLNYEGDVSVIAKHFLNELHNHPELAMAILSDLANDHLPQN